MPQKSSGGGYGGQRSDPVGSNFGGGSGHMGGGGGRTDGLNSRTINPRTTPTPIASGPFTAQNIAAAIGMALPGGYARSVVGLNPSFDTTPGTGTHYGYDASNRAGTGQYGMGAGMAGGMGGRPINPAWLQHLSNLNGGQSGRGMLSPLPQPTGMMNQPPPNGLAPQTMPGKYIGIGGPTLPAYGAAVPGYNYFR